LDRAKIERNVVKVKDLYVEKGFFLADVGYHLEKVDENNSDLYIDIQENAKISIREIRIIGNKKLKTEDILGIMMLRKGGFFSFMTSSGKYQEAAVERDVMAISALYYDQGYVNVKVSDPQVSIGADKRSIYISIHIDEGERFKLRRVDIGGDMIWEKSDLKKLLDAKEDQYFSRTNVGKDREMIARRYKDEGYAFVNVNPLTNVLPEDRLLDVTYDIEKGPKVEIERIEVSGNQTTRDKVIRREMKISEGDIFNQTAIDRSKSRITALGYFEAVELTTREGSGEDKIIVGVKVKERPTGSIQVGAGFSSLESFIANATISQNNLLGRGQRLSLQAQISGLRQQFSLSFAEPYFLDTRVTFGFNLFNNSNIVDFFRRRSTGGALTWGYALTDFLRFFAMYRAEVVNISTSNAGALFGSNFFNPLPQGVRIFNLFNAGFTSLVRGTVQFDTRNNRLLPTKGVYMSGWAETAAPWMGSQNQFDRIGAFARFYYPIWGPFIFRLNSQVGWVTSRADNGIPNWERYRVGGIMSVRGFFPSSIGPKLEVPPSSRPDAPLISVNKGGDKQLVFNAEIEIPIIPKAQLRGVVFSDAGMAFDDDQWATLLNLRHSLGFMCF